MQDRYEGDVGDFGKFILLNQVIRVGGRQLRLGVNWYRVMRPEPESNDDRHIAYLSSTTANGSQFAKCNPEIYAKIRNIVCNTRSTLSLERSGVLPRGTLFFSDPVPFGSSSFLQREAERDEWFDRSIRLFQSANVLFLDPDNGIQPPKVRKTQTRAIKYAFVDEIQRYFNHCDLVVVYNHRDRTTRDKYPQKFLDVQNKLSASAQLRVLRFKRVSVRDYAFFYKKALASVITEVFKKLTAAPLDFLFEELNPI